jgi:hypothetical protein
MQYETLFVIHDQKFESVPQSFVVSHYGSNLDRVRWEREGEFQGNNFSSLQLTAQGCPEAILAEFAGSAPEFGGHALAKH